MKISNRLYDTLKYIALIGLPAVTGLVLSITEIWNLPYGAEIGATVSAVAIALGALLGLSSAQYKKQK